MRTRWLLPSWLTTAVSVAVAEAEDARRPWPWRRNGRARRPAQFGTLARWKESTLANADGVPSPLSSNRPSRPRSGAALQSVRCWAVPQPLLAVLLLLQWTHRQRDDLAARWPVLRGPLTSWCALAGCDISPPRALAALALDSSALSRTGTPQVLRFVADLRNTAGHPVRAPAVELSFTDPLGRLLVRKVLLPEQLAAPSDGIPADEAWHIEAPLLVGDLRIAGFSAEVFYP